MELALSMSLLKKEETKRIWNICFVGSIPNIIAVTSFGKPWNSILCSCVSKEKILSTKNKMVLNSFESYSSATNLIKWTELGNTITELE